MNKELKISISILVVGVLAITAYWFAPMDKTIKQSNRKYNQNSEKIVLPKHLNNKYQETPLVRSYIRDIKEMIKRGEAVLPLNSNELDAKAEKVQELLLKNQSFLKDTKQNNKILHNDMMRILPVITSALNKKVKEICVSNECYQAEKYNFVTNSTTRAIVDVKNLKVLSVEHYSGMQPDISLRLTNIAKEIALYAPEVANELGEKPSRKDMTMANVRGTMKESPCDNTEHLCVAPTFANHQTERALWAVVDLTELRLAAAKWAGLGKTTTPACISERTLQNRFIMENYCQKDTLLDKNGWKILYRITGSDGLEVRDVTFKGRPVLHSAKIVDWHVSYQQEGGENLDTSTETYMEGRLVEFVRGENGKYAFGYNDAMGCPMFSTSVVLAFNGPQIKTLKGNDGFMLTQDFRNPKWPMSCNYRYENRFEFYNDGSFRIVGVNKGRGCGENALYRPVMRIDMNIAKEEVLEDYSSGEWQVWESEHSLGMKAETEYKNNKYLFRITDKENSNMGYYIEPNRGQFGDKSRGDHATLFASKFKALEGDTDLLTLGSCCDLEIDGAESYLEDNESLNGENIVLWYVPRIQNDARDGHEYCWADTSIADDGNVEVKVWPCAVGPKFVPIVKDNL